MPLHDLRCPECKTERRDVYVRHTLPACECGAQMAVYWGHGFCPHTPGDPLVEDPDGGPDIRASEAKEKIAARTGADPNKLVVRPALREDWRTFADGLRHSAYEDIKKTGHTPASLAEWSRERRALRKEHR